MAKNTEWPAGTLGVVSREAYDAIRRARGYDFMTPAERLVAAKEYDEFTCFPRWLAEVAKLLGRTVDDLKIYGDMPRDQWESGIDAEQAAEEIRDEDREWEGKR